MLSAVREDALAKFLQFMEEQRQEVSPDVAVSLLEDNGWCVAQTLQSIGIDAPRMGFLQQEAIGIDSPGTRLSQEDTGESSTGSHEEPQAQLQAVARGGCAQRSVDHLQHFGTLLERVLTVAASSNLDVGLLHASLNDILQTIRAPVCQKCAQDWHALGLVRELERAAEELTIDGADLRERFMSTHERRLKVHYCDSELWFTHDTVNSQFSHGEHKGRYVFDLVERLVKAGQKGEEADILQHERLTFDAVFHHGRYKAFQNRRLWAVWEASRRLGRALIVRVRVHPLLPNIYYNHDEKPMAVLHKFEISHSSTNNGGEPELREPTWLRKYREAKREDGTLLRTSELKLLDQLLHVARRVVEGPESVFVLSGSTGCGKSTQMPQAIYDYVRGQENDGPSVVCTQPRRVAACALDEQVNVDRTCRDVWPEERRSRITAHQIKGHTNKSHSTKILYCTAGVLVQMLRSDAVREFRYIFLDEVHERTIEDDLLMAFLCQEGFLYSGTKVIVMSATLIVDQLVSYVSGRLRLKDRVATIDLDSGPEVERLSESELRENARQSGVAVGMLDSLAALRAQLLAAQVLRSHAVRLVYLDDLISAVPTRLDPAVVDLHPVGPRTPELSRAAAAAWEALKSEYPMKSSEQVADELLHRGDLQMRMVISPVRERFAQLFCGELMRKQVRHEAAAPSQGYVTLTFLPGVSMISDFQYSLQEDAQLDPSEVRPLHGKVHQEEQNQAVQDIRHSERRAILATNVAESSITVPNADVVIDLCLAREMRWNDDRGTQLLDLSFAAKDSLSQRAGRVGRTKPGLVIRMLTRMEHEQLRRSRTPEMLRQPVESVMLKVICIGGAHRSGGIDAEMEVKQCLSPPEDDKISEALDALEQMSAIQEVSRTEGRRLWRPMRLGVILDDLPVSVELGVIAVRGFMIGIEACAADAAAVLHAHNVMAEPRSTLRDGGKASVGYWQQLRHFAQGFPCDAVMLVNLLRAFRAKAKSVNWTLDGGSRGEAELRDWCKRNNANFRSLCSVDPVSLQIREKLQAVAPLLEEPLLEQGLPHEFLTQEEAALLMLLKCGSFQQNMLQVYSAPARRAPQMQEDEVELSWRNSRNNSKTLQSINGFFTGSTAAVHGEIIEDGITGTQDGWVRVRLHPHRNSTNVFGVLSEVTDVLKLERDLSKLLNDHQGGSPTAVTVSHKYSTHSLPLFQRWEPLTKKLKKVALDTNSVATFYLESMSIEQDSVRAAIVPMRFESFETKTRNKWQKGEGLTLLPLGGGGCKFAALILTIFGTPAARGVSRGVDTVREDVTELARGSMADDCLSLKQGLTGAQSLLQDFDFSDSSAAFSWTQRTTELRRRFVKLINACGGISVLRALARPKHQDATEAYVGGSMPGGASALLASLEGSLVGDDDFAAEDGDWLFGPAKRPHNKNVASALQCETALDSPAKRSCTTNFAIHQGQQGAESTSSLEDDLQRALRLSLECAPATVLDDSKPASDVTASVQPYSKRNKLSTVFIPEEEEAEIEAAMRASLEDMHIKESQPASPCRGEKPSSETLRQLRLRHFAPESAAASHAASTHQSAPETSRTSAATEMASRVQDPQRALAAAAAPQAASSAHAVMCPDCGLHPSSSPFCGRTGQSHESCATCGFPLLSSRFCPVTGKSHRTPGLASAEDRTTEVVACAQQEEHVERIMGCIGCSREAAVRALLRAGGQLDRAVELLL